jgi:hypothetical protein
VKKILVVWFVCAFATLLVPQFVRAESLPPHPVRSELVGIDLANCRWDNGTILTPELCEKLRVSELKKQEAKAIKEKMRAEFEEQRRLKAEIVKEAAAATAERNRIAFEQREQDEADRRAALKKKQDAEDAESDRQERIYAKKAADSINAKKQVCGDDFSSPKIGMTIERAQQCVAKFKLISQLNRADGVISMYSGGGYYLHVMNGKIVSWQR